MFRLGSPMMGPGPNQNPSGGLRQLYWHFFPIVHLKETAKRFNLGGVSKYVSKMQSAWIMFVTDRPRCWANLEKTKCILGMRVKILLRRKSQSVQSGIRQHGFSVQDHCNIQNHKLQKNTNHNGCRRAVGGDGLQMQKLANSKQHSLVGQIHFPLHRKYLKSYIVNISLLQYASLLVSMLVSSLKDLNWLTSAFRRKKKFREGFRGTDVEKS